MNKKCMFDGCLKDSFSKGLCSAHYQQQRKGEALKPLQEQHHGLSEYDRFMKRVVVKDSKNCWEWTGSRNQKGWHGQWRNKAGQIELAHRASWRLHRGGIPGKLFVLHHCDNPICVNPLHLYLGSQADNVKDMWDRHRANPGVSLGEKHGNSKLTAENVVEIRASKEPDKVLAEKFGLSPTTIGDVRRRKTWKHVD